MRGQPWGWIGKTPGLVMTQTPAGCFSLRPWCRGFTGTGAMPALGMTAPPMAVALRGPAPKAFLEGAVVFGPHRVQVKPVSDQSQWPRLKTWFCHLEQPFHGTLPQFPPL